MPLRELLKENNMRYGKNNQQAFTLVELLIIIGVMAVLATATVLILNPAEFLARARDTNRVTSLDSLHKALLIFEANVAGNLGDSAKVYISLPDINNDNCATSTGGSAYSLPPLTTGKTYWCVGEANLRKLDGNGWVPVDFMSIPDGSPFSKLPVDPVNSESANLYYTYVMGGSWQLTALTEAEKHDAAIEDGGRMPGVYEKGSNLSLGPFNRDHGLVGYWAFDDNGGIIARDSSGSGYNGTLVNSPIWTSGCRLNYCLNFSNDPQSNSRYVNLGNILDFAGNAPYTFSAWISPTTSAPPTWERIFNSEQWTGSIRDGYSLIQNKTSGVICTERFLNNGGTQTSVTRCSAVAASAGVWNHVAAVYDGKTLKVYLNGIASSSISATFGLAENAGNLNIGRFSPGGGYFDGLIDDARIYNRALSDAEIKALYSVGG